MKPKTIKIPKGIALGELTRRRYSPIHPELDAKPKLPPGKPPLQELALQVPAAVREKLDAYQKRQLKWARGPDGAGDLGQVAHDTVLHVLHVGIAAYLDVERGDMEEVWGGLEKERDKSREAGGDAGAMAELYWLSLPVQAQQHIRDLAIGVQDPPGAGPLPIRVAQEVAGVAISAYLDINDELASPEGEPVPFSGHDFESLGRREHAAGLARDEYANPEWRRGWDAAELASRETRVDKIKRRCDAVRDAVREKLASKK